MPVDTRILPVKGIESNKLVLHYQQGEVNTTNFLHNLTRLKLTLQLNLDQEWKNKGEDNSRAK